MNDANGGEFRYRFVMRSENPIERYAGFLLDIDGVLVRGREPIPGAAEGLSQLKRIGRTILLTNNSTRTRRAHARRLNSLGFPVKADEIVPSSYIAARYLARKFGKAAVWPIGEEGLTEELEAAGHRIVEPPDAEWVVVGMDRNFGYDSISRALRALLSGARLIATNTDATFPTPEGLLPGAGAMVGALAGMGYRPEIVVGKPSPIAYETALELIDAPLDRILMIGDRLETDVAGAERVGIDAAYLLSGVGRLEDVDRSGPNPKWVAADLSDLAAGKFVRRPTDG